MKTYELTYLLSPESKEQEIESIFSKIRALVQEQDGVVIENRNQGIIELGNEIKTQKTAFLATLRFQMNPLKQKLFREKIKKGSKILRYSILIRKPVREKARMIKRQIKKTPEQKKVELKGIEEKLAELLG